VGRKRESKRGYDNDVELGRGFNVKVSYPKGKRSKHGIF